jgi:plastocyanin
MRDRFKILTLSTVGMMFLLILGAPAAAGGGGCHQGTTTAASGPDGATIEMIDACFTPTTLRVDPGAEVTFVNRDDMTHNVTANAWGHFDDLELGGGFTVTFGDSGIYPYACNYHPGMTGAIVVGDGTGAGTSETIGVVDAFQAPEPVVVTKTVASERGQGGWIAAGALGLLLGTASGFGIARRRRTTAA